jgi:hypothetical protein
VGFVSELDMVDQTLLPAPHTERIRYIVRDRPDNQCGRLRHIAVQDVVDVDANARLQQRRQRIKTLVPKRRYRCAISRFSILRDPRT